MTRMQHTQVNCSGSCPHAAPQGHCFCFLLIFFVCPLRPSRHANSSEACNPGARRTVLCFSTSSGACERLQMTRAAWPSDKLDSVFGNNSGFETRQDLCYKSAWITLTAFGNYFAKCAALQACSTTSAAQGQAIPHVHGILPAAQRRWKQEPQKMLAVGQSNSNASGPQI